MYQGTVNDLGGILRGPVPRRCENREDLGEPPRSFTEQSLEQEEAELGAGAPGTRRS